MYKAEMIADSMSQAGIRIATMMVTMPRIILAEFNTHRMLSRNSASSRAIPFKKMVQAVEENPFVPLRWMKDHPGMQGTEYFNEDESKICVQKWMKAHELSTTMARNMNEAGISKQVVNRLLEPFMWQTVLVTATDWENFFALRDDPAAEIHMQHVAHLMLECMNSSKPKILKDDEWHIPFGDQINDDEILQKVANKEEVSHITSAYDIYLYYALKIATARCAQTSYTIVGEDGKAMDYVKLIALHDRLAKAGHWSPFEHCAKVMDEVEYNRYVRGYTDGVFPYITDPVMLGWCGNFRGFIQYRKTFKNENRKDPRLINKAIA